jgi:hypothetical protein
LSLKIEDVGDLERDYRERLVIDLSFSVRAVMKRFHANQNGKYHIPAEYANEVVYGNGLKAFCRCPVRSGRTIIGTDKHRWSRHMISLLVEMNRYRKRLIAQSQTGNPQGTPWTVWKEDMTRFLRKPGRNESDAIHARSGRSKKKKP